MLARKKMFFTPDEYLNMEKAAAYKSEFYNGEIFAMAGGTPDHSKIALRLGAELLRLLDDKPCDVFNSDLRLLVKEENLYTYPDLMIVCGKIEYAPNRRDIITNPHVIVEVLSDSTRDYDRGEKFNFYKTLPSLREYVLVESTQARVECYRRAGIKWTVEMYIGLDAIAKLESVACEIPLRQIYQRISWLA